MRHKRMENRYRAEFITRSASEATTTKLQLPAEIGRARTQLHGKGELSSNILPRPHIHVPIVVGAEPVLGKLQSINSLELIVPTRRIGLGNCGGDGLEDPVRTVIMYDPT